jgi:fimbrial chaperone protein
MKPRVWLHAACSVALLCLTAASGEAVAAGLQVAPVMLNLKPTQNADGLWLSNTGDKVLHAQVRVYHWTQDSHGDQLTESRGLVISPPMLELSAGDKQLVRVIRLGPPPGGDGAVEDAYRLLIDELPIDTQGGKGLQFVLHYSVPIFVEPAGAPVAAPQLSWQLQPEGDHVTLQVGNQGASHAQLANVSYTAPDGHRMELAPGLLGYVLPGAVMHWALKASAATLATGGTLEAMVNGTLVTQPLPLADRAH